MSEIQVDAPASKRSRWKQLFILIGVIALLYLVYMTVLWLRVQIIKHNLRANGQSLSFNELTNQWPQVSDADNGATDFEEIETQIKAKKDPETFNKHIPLDQDSQPWKPLDPAALKTAEEFSDPFLPQLESAEKAITRPLRFHAKPPSSFSAPILSEIDVPGRAAFNDSMYLAYLRGLIAIEHGDLKESMRWMQFQCTGLRVAQSGIVMDDYLFQLVFMARLQKQVERMLNRLKIDASTLDEIKKHLPAKDNRQAVAIYNSQIRALTMDFWSQPNGYQVLSGPMVYSYEPSLVVVKSVCGIEFMEQALFLTQSEKFIDSYRKPMTLPIPKETQDLWQWMESRSGFTDHAAYLPFNFFMETGIFYRGQNELGQLMNAGMIAAQIKLKSPDFFSTDAPPPKEFLDSLPSVLSTLSGRIEFERDPDGSCYVISYQTIQRDIRMKPEKQPESVKRFCIQAPTIIAQTQANQSSP